MMALVFVFVLKCMLCSSFPVVITDASHRHLEIGGCLILQLICKWVDLEPIQPEIRDKITSTLDSKINLWYAGLLHITIFTEVCLCQNSRGTPSHPWIFQWPVMTEPCFNFFNTPVANKSVWNITIYRHQEMFYKFWRLQSPTTDAEGDLAFIWEISAIRSTDHISSTSSSLSSSWWSLSQMI